MKKFKINNFLDIFSKYLSIFFIFLVFFRCFKIDFYVCILFSSLACLLFFFIISMFKRLNNKRNFKKKEDALNINNITEQFKFTSPTMIKSYLIKVFRLKYSVAYHKMGFVYSPGGEKILVIPFFDYEKLNVDRFINLYRSLQSSKIKNVIIFCFDYETDCINMLKRFKSKKYQILNIEELYKNVIKPSMLMPNFKVEKLNVSINLRGIMLSVFNRKKAKKYFWFGVLIFLLSFFVPISIYYLVFSLILFTLSFISRFVIKSQSTIPSQNIW